MARASAGGDDRCGHALLEHALSLSSASSRRVAPSRPALSRTPPVGAQVPPREGCARRWTRGRLRGGRRRAAADDREDGMALETDPVITVEGLRKAYGSTTAVDGVSFSVQAGEVFGLLGSNGAGKTTTVECLEGLRRPTRARSACSGVDPLGAPRAPARPRRLPAPGVASARPHARSGRRCDLFAAAAPRPSTGRRCSTAWGPRRQARRRLRQPLRRPAAAAARGAGARDRPRGRLSRRDDDRPRPGGAAHDLGAHRGDPRARHDGRPRHALHGRGRAALRPRRRHGRGPHRRDGHAGRA